MTLDLANATGIDPQDYKSLLDDLQGNILKGHGRPQVCLLSIRFTADAAVARQWVHAFGGWVTPASRQERQAAVWKKRQDVMAWQGPRQAAWQGYGESLFASLFLTCAGYRHIGVDDGQIPPDPRFRAGMAGSQAVLGDPSGADWDPPYDPDEAPTHALVLLAASSADLLQTKCAYVQESLDAIATVDLQKGRVLREKGASDDSTGWRYVDHLNHADGRSQPLFFGKDVDSEIDRDGIGEYDPSAPLSLVLVQEPEGPGGQPGGHGSYLVYRKLEQNVRGFKTAERKAGDTAAPSLADQLGLVGDEERKRAGAMIVGRFENGTPVALVPRASLKSAPNNFHYGDDPAGARCPLFSHIRKINPRTPSSREHRIVRRGITYDDVGRAAPPSDEDQPYDQMPTHGVGLLFMCFQASIEHQFEHLQRAANDPDFPAAGVGIDPLAGQGDESGKTYQWPAQWGQGATVTAAFASFARLRTGEYFFAPSRSFFRTLGEAPGGS